MQSAGNIQPLLQCHVLVERRQDIFQRIEDLALPLPSHRILLRLASKHERGL